MIYVIRMDKLLERDDWSLSRIDYYVRHGLIERFYRAGKPYYRGQFSL